MTFLDTADAYPLGGELDTVGRTEEILGRWLQGKRDDFIVATKCFAPTGRNPWNMGNSRRHILDSIDASLRRLQTDFVDLYQLHFDDPGVPIDESLGALDDLVRAGKVRYIGCSNFLAYRLALALGRSEVRGIARFDSVQPRYNLLFREFERELFPLCIEQGVGVIPYNPIAGGMLSGKHDRTKPPEEGTRFTLGNAARTYQDRYWHDNVFDTVDELVKIASDAGIPLPTLAVAWTLRTPRDHVTDRRCEPARSARRDARGSRPQARCRPRRPAQRGDRALPTRRCPALNAGHRVPSLFVRDA